MKKYLLLAVGLVILGVRHFGETRYLRGFIDGRAALADEQREVERRLTRRYYRGPRPGGFGSSGFDTGGVVPGPGHAG